MSEPDWVYRQRRQRAVGAGALVIGVIAFLIVVGSTVSDGFDLGGPSHKNIAMPDPDAVLAREQRQIAADKQRKAQQRHQPAQRKVRPRRHKEPKSAKPRQAAKPSSPAPAPTQAARPQPATPPPPTPASTPPPAPAPQPHPSSTGGVDPRFY